MAKKKTEKPKIGVKLEPLNHKNLTIKIYGKTPLLMDKLPESVMEGIVKKQTGQAKGAKKKVRDLEQEKEDAVHKTSRGIIGFPVAGFKRGMMEVTSFVGDKFFSKKLVSGAVRIINGDDGLVPIKFKKQGILKHNIGSNVKYTPMFEEWSCELVMQYDANNISSQDIMTLLQHAGFYVGVGAWRPKCRDGGSGEYGMYDIVKPKKGVM